MAQTIVMADPLVLLRDYNINKVEIIETDTDIVFGELSWNKRAKTNFLISGSGKKGTVKDYYTLECLLYFLRNSLEFHPMYVRKAAEANIQAVRRPDRKELLGYLTGNLPACPSVDKNAPLALPNQGGRNNGSGSIRNATSTSQKQCQPDQTRSDSRSRPHHSDRSRSNTRRPPDESESRHVAQRHDHSRSDPYHRDSDHIRSRSRWDPQDPTDLQYNDNRSRSGSQQQRDNIEPYHLPQDSDPNGQSRCEERRNRDREGRPEHPEDYERSRHGNHPRSITQTYRHDEDRSRSGSQRYRDDLNWSKHDTRRQPPDQNEPSFDPNRSSPIRHQGRIDSVQIPLKSDRLERLSSDLYQRSGNFDHGTSEPQHLQPNSVHLVAGGQQVHPNWHQHPPGWDPTMPPEQQLQTGWNPSLVSQQLPNWTAPDLGPQNMSLQRPPPWGHSGSQSIQPLPNYALQLMPVNMDQTVTGMQQAPPPNHIQASAMPPPPIWEGVIPMNMPPPIWEKPNSDMELSSPISDKSSIDESVFEKREPKCSKFKETSKIKDSKKHELASREDNEYIIFGKHVAAALKKMSEQQAIIAQDQIQAILSRCRLNDLQGK